jgi:hypothetical protein
VLKVSEPPLLLVRRNIRRRKVDKREAELVRSGARHGKMAAMHRIECPAKQCYLHLSLRSNRLICSFSS